MNIVEKAAWITGILGFLGALIPTVIQKVHVPDLTGIVGTELQHDKALLSLVKRVFPGDTSSRTQLKRSHAGLFRTGVRHVIFRQETACHIISQIDGDALFALAKEIGMGAAKDLFKQIQQAIDKGKIDLKTVLTPAQVLGLFSFWDHTGGWGNYRLLDTDSDDTEWKIRVENDFLNIEEAGKWCDFWRGYFWGLCAVCIQSLVDLSGNITALPKPIPVKIQAGAVKDVKCERHNNHLLCIIQLTMIGE
jgi:hypothetical protein